MRIKISIILVFIGLWNTDVFAQLGLIPLESNNRLSHYRSAHPNYEWNSGSLEKYGVDDTLELPFFEDFTSSTLYPDSTKWRDNDVYVNRHFPIQPPSYGVATFDFLNEFGSPYKTLQKDLTGGGDTLTSQAINLKSKNSQSLSAADSVYLSFYYQPRGLGDFIKPGDSLLLQFLSDSGVWNKVWARAGTGFSSFVQVIIPITNPKYFFEGFQFRFINWTHYWGNNNHWHLDHVYLDSDRSFDDLNFNDYSIQSLPTGLLRRYHAMPYDHFIANMAAELEDSVSIRIANNDNRSINALVRYDFEHKGTSLGSSLFSENSGQLSAKSSTIRQLGTGDLTGLTGFPIIIDRHYFVKENGTTNPDPFKSNDDLSTTQVFDRYFAYDDGSAESGFGFNDLNGKEGSVAVRFELNKADTLRAIGFFYTHNINVLGDVRYNIEIWRSIARPGRTDELAASFPVRRAQYTKEINGYYYFILDEPIALDAGEFYVGWSQGSDFNLGVGFDKNGGNLFQGVALNKDIFFNVGDGWLENTSSDLVGVPMIRPMVGLADPFVAHAPSHDLGHVIIYPNPASESFNIALEDMTLKKVSIMDLNGKSMPVFALGNNEYDVSQLNPGLYFVKLLDENDVVSIQKLIID